jgi:hypothetical protein
VIAAAWARHMAEEALVAEQEALDSYFQGEDAFIQVCAVGMRAVSAAIERGDRRDSERRTPANRLPVCNARRSDTDNLRGS